MKNLYTDFTREFHGNNILVQCTDMSSGQLPQIYINESTLQENFDHYKDYMKVAFWSIILMMWQKTRKVSWYCFGFFV